MTRTKITDVTDRVPDKNYITLLMVCERQKVFNGTFCFPFGPEFGCGSTMKLTRGESKTFEGSFSIKGIGGKASVTYTASTAWSHASARCEWCVPEICYPNSQMQIWKCERFLDWKSWISTEVDFFPGRPQIFPDCKVDNAKCSCTPAAQPQTTPSVSQVGGVGGYEGTEEEALATRLIVPASFSEREGEPSSTDLEQELLDASELVEGFAQSREGEGEIASVLVAQPAGKNICIFGDGKTDKDVGLLSMGCSDLETGVLNIPHSLNLSVLAVGPGIENAKAKVRITKQVNGKVETVLEDQAPTLTKNLTTIWKQFKIPQAKFKSGSKGTLEIVLLDATGREKAAMKMPVQRRHVPA